MIITTKESSKRRAGRVEIYAVKAEVLENIDKGYTMAAIYEDLKISNRITMSYSNFCRWFRKGLQAKSEAKMQPTRHKSTPAIEVQNNESSQTPPQKSQGPLMNFPAQRKTVDMTPSFDRDNSKATDRDSNLKK